MSSPPLSFVDPYATGKTVEIGKSDESMFTENIITVHNVHKTYLLGVEGVPALRGVSLTIKRGEFVMILGTSGGGKTSLLNILGTIDKPTKGEINIAGQRITSTTTDAEFAALRLKHIGFVFQTFNLIPSMTALENIELPMVLEGKKTRKEMRDRAQRLLERVGLGERGNHLPSQLSGGEQQRVTIARAIANRPQLLLLDEPTGDLDTLNGTIILNLLLQLNRFEGITCVMVTHDQSLKHYAHRVIHMVDGRVLRIEHVSPEIRRKADAELQKQVNEIHEDREARRERERERIQLAPTTECRDPSTFYDYIREQERRRKKSMEKRASLLAHEAANAAANAATLLHALGGQPPHPSSHLHASSTAAEVGTSHFSDLLHSRSDHHPHPHHVNGNGSINNGNGHGNGLFDEAL